MTAHDVRPPRAAAGFAIDALAVAAAGILVLRGHGGAAPTRRPAVLAGLLGPAAVGIGVAVEAGPLHETFRSGQTLDACVQQADPAELQRLCEAQHLDELMQRYPRSDE